MSTTTPATTMPRADIHARPGIPFGRLLRTELRKLTDTRAGKWLLVAIIAITVGVVVVAVFAAPTKDLTYDKFVDYTQTAQRFLLPVIGILAITSEWSQRTGLVTFTLEPRRGRVLLAKVLATLILGALVICASFATAAVGNLLGMAVRQGNGSWAFGLGGFRDIALVQLTTLLQGMAFGMVLLISAVAIVVSYAPDLWSQVFNISALKSVAPWIDLNHAQNPLYNHDMTAISWAHLLVAVVIWVVVPLVFGVMRVRRTEIKSA